MLLKAVVILMKRVLFVLAIIGLISCNRDSPELSPEGIYPPSIEPPFIEYVARFLEEAEKRGLNGNDEMVEAIQSLTIAFDANLDFYCGWADWSEDSDQVIISIGIQPRCWSESSDTDKEILIFHELGYGLLQRFHLDERLPNGDFKSLMHAGNQFGLYQEQDVKRSYYLDELFDPDTSIPEWAKD